MGKHKHYFIVDLFALFHRSYHAMKKARLTTSDGTDRPCGGTLSFLRTLLKQIKDDTSITDLVVVTEGKQSHQGDNFKVSGYKAGRKKNSESFYTDLSLLTEEVLPALGVPVISKEKYEADDTIASLIRHLLEKDSSTQITVFTCDSDLFQTIRHSQRVTVRQFNSAKKITDWNYNSKFVNKHGVTPEFYVEWKAMVGDKADNIDGVKGIGPKTASSIIADLGSNWLTHPKIRNSRELVIRNYRLILLNDSLRFEDYQINSSISEFDWEKYNFTVQNLGLKTAKWNQ